MWKKLKLFLNLFWVRIILRFKKKPMDRIVGIIDNCIKTKVIPNTPNIKFDRDEPNLVCTLDSVTFQINYRIGMVNMYGFSLLIDFMNDKDIKYTYDNIVIRDGELFNTLTEFDKHLCINKEFINGIIQSYCKLYRKK